jgi:hypothetical protein
MGQRHDSGSWVCTLPQALAVFVAEITCPAHPAPALRPLIARDGFPAHHLEAHGDNSLTIAEVVSSSSSLSHFPSPAAQVTPIVIRIQMGMGQCGPFSMFGIVNQIKRSRTGTGARAASTSKRRV